MFQSIAEQDGREILSLIGNSTEPRDVECTLGGQTVESCFVDCSHSCSHILRSSNPTLAGGRPKEAELGALAPLHGLVSLG